MYYNFGRRACNGRSNYITKASRILWNGWDTCIVEIQSFLQHNPYILHRFRLHFHSEHLSQALGNLEHRLLNEINHLRAMINLLLPPLYQQHYFAKPKPELYQPFPPLSTLSLNSTNIVGESNESDQIQNESPTTIKLMMNNATAPIEPLNVSESATLATEDTTEPITERQLKFKPVQKKTGDRLKPLHQR